MSEPIASGKGWKLEGERAEDRNSPFHMRIVTAARILGTRSGHRCKLECGHVVQIFGNLESAGGVALCTECRDGKRP